MSCLIRLGELRRPHGKAFLVAKNGDAVTSRTGTERSSFSFGLTHRLKAMNEATASGTLRTLIDVIKL